MKRFYLPIIQKHFAENSQMLFLVGPRQVGKTTISKQLAETYVEKLYLNWDVIKDRALILTGQDFIESIIPSNRARAQKPLVIFDEIHKFDQWKNYLKGFYDIYKDKLDILVTGSARMDIYMQGGDSLMGRYFLCHVHPFSAKEISPSNNSLDILYQFGGFPEPFLKQDGSFSQKWHSLREKQLIYEDIKNLATISEINQLEVLAMLLKNQAGQLMNRSNLAKKVQVTVPTISRWLKILEKFYYCFAVTPYSTNITRSLIKEHKIYLWDWSLIDDPGMKFENFIASHLLKAIDYWNDTGVGSYRLHFIRNKDQKEVDFLVTQNAEPWFLVEAKLSDSNRISESLGYYKKQIGAKHAFQVVYNLPYLDVDCFTYREPMIVPASTFLLQLV